MLNGENRSERGEEGTLAQGRRQPAAGAASGSVRWVQAGSSRPDSGAGHDAGLWVGVHRVCTMRSQDGP